MTARQRTALVIGGGASGTLTATHLLRTTPYHVVLVEPGHRPGRGVAYGTTDDRHLLNSRADTMSADSARPADFLNWCHAHGLAGGPGAFQPRRAYGDYLLDTLTAADRCAGGRLTRVRDSATRLYGTPDGVAVSLASGRTYPAGPADLAVLAVGQAPPADPPAIGPGLRHHPRYVADPWHPGALERVPADAPTLLVGTGLTAIDVALTLTRRTRTAPIHAVSRHGLLPQAHLPAAPAPGAHPSALAPGADAGLATFAPGADADPAAEGSAAGSAASIPAATGPYPLAPLVRQVRAAATDAADWRTAVDALRPYLDPLWRRLDVAERQRFLRHAARWWEVHRHRTAPPVAAAVNRLRSTGCLLAGAGAIVRVEPSGDRLAVTVRRPDATIVVHRVGAVVNCTGPRSALELPLVRALVSDGYARPDELGLGIAVDSAGAPDPAGPQIRVVGPARRGTLWETTAVPEIRAQAEAVAATAQPAPVRRPALV